MDSLQCEPVAKQPVLKLKWKCPVGNNSGFRIKIYNISTSEVPREELASRCMVEGFEETSNITNLNFFSTYNVTVMTLQNGFESSPVDKLCHTSITGKH